MKWKLIVIIFVSIFCFSALNILAMTQYPYTKKPKEYLITRDAIVYAIKVSGNMGRFEYSERIAKYSDLNGDQLKNKWYDVTSQVKEQYIVIKPIKGTQKQPGDILSFPNERFMGGTFSGRGYILFLSENGAEYRIKPCDFADVTDLKHKELNQLLELNHEQMIARIWEKYLLNCHHKLVERK